jgi:hypothetical protein
MAENPNLAHDSDSHAGTSLLTVEEKAKVLHLKSPQQSKWLTILCVRYIQGRRIRRSILRILLGLTHCYMDHRSDFIHASRTKN